MKSNFSCSKYQLIVCYCCPHNVIIIQSVVYCRKLYSNRDDMFLVCFLHGNFQLYVTMRVSEIICLCRVNETGRTIFSFNLCQPTDSNLPLVAFCNLSFKIVGNNKKMAEIGSVMEKS